MIATLGILFFVSGACALVYQVLWLRLMGLVFGVTIHAASTVFAVFMGGLAAGSVLAGRLGSRTVRPLRWFGAAEAGIGLSAALSPLVVRWLQSLYVALHPALPDAPAAVTVARFLVAALALVVPTLLMGATLPLVLRSSFVRDRATGEAEIGRRLAFLYAANTAGAIAGTLLSGLLLIPRAGISRTFALAAAANGLVALQWVAGTEQELRLIVRTFMGVFPETTLWADGSLMVGTKRPLRLRRGDFEWRLRLPPLDRELPKFGLGSFADLLKQFRGGAAELRALVGPGPLLTDDRPVVEYFLALPRGQPMDLSPLRGDVRPYLADVR
ncbi:MAG TPA: fused MFS/spermidine synthase [Vicinamibacterales bacterium]|nr:fused MFS/spermidine synthase [Vicinamibacterales bacterium]